MRLFRRFDPLTAGRHLLTTGADGALHSALLRWIVSRASGGYSKHARVVRISSTLSRDTTASRNGPRWRATAVIHAFLLKKGEHMPGSTSAGFHEGSRSEYLAQYVFASFGTVTVVPHQEDTGLDLYCTLTERLGRNIWPRAYFSV